MASDSATANYSNTYGEREERTQENDRKKDKCDGAIIATASIKHDKCHNSVS